MDGQVGGWATWRSAGPHDGFVLSCVFVLGVSEVLRAFLFGMRFSSGFRFCTGNVFCSGLRSCSACRFGSGCAVVVHVLVVLGVTAV